METKVSYQEYDRLIKHIDYVKNENFRKLVSAFLKKNKMSLDKVKEYMANYTEEQFIAQIKSRYNIKEVTPGTMLRAKLKTEYPDEYFEQKELVKYLRDNKIKCQSSGNGFKLDTGNNINYMSKLKATGLSKGYPDIDVFIGNGITLHIEMKRIKGSVVSEDQTKWIEWFNNNGYIAKICYGHLEAIEFVENNIKLSVDK